MYLHPSQSNFSFEAGFSFCLEAVKLQLDLSEKGGMKMLSLDKVFNAQTVLKNIIREIKLLKSGRSSSLLIELIDKPGQLKEISCIIADCGGNVTGVHNEKGNTESVNGCFLCIEMETRDFEHVNLITKTLRDEGFKLV